MLVVPTPLNYDPSQHHLFYGSEDRSDLEMIESKPIIRDVIIKQTDAEKERKRREYRREYMKRPAVQERVREKLNRPEVIARRKAYAEREDVKLRKQELAARSRKIRRVLKEEEPIYWAKICDKVENNLTST